MNEIVWGDPPPKVTNRKGTGAVWPQRLAPLMKRRGKWARVWEFDKVNKAAVAASQLRHGRLATPPGRWEFVSRMDEEKSYIWARYMGPEE